MPVAWWRHHVCWSECRWVYRRPMSSWCLQALQKMSALWLVTEYASQCDRWCGANTRGHWQRSEWGTQHQRAMASSLRASGSCWALASERCFLGHFGVVDNLVHSIHQEWARLWAQWYQDLSFMMDIACHPLKDPCLWIPVVASNVESCIEL